MSQYEFIINNISVSCPSCDEVFATQISYKVPDMMVSLPVEADLHRVLPYGSIRSCLVTICPQCQYAWWTNTFCRSFRLSIGLGHAPEIDSARKFAHAVLTGRKNNFNSLDRTILALNGYWCAKENHQETGKWLTLTIQELTATLADSNWEGNRARYHYLLGELLRLNGQFEEAIKEFDLVDASSNLPIELISNQKALAQNSNSDSVLLSNAQVQEIFFPELVIQHFIIPEITQQAAQEITQEIVQEIVQEIAQERVSGEQNNTTETSTLPADIVDFGPIQSSIPYNTVLFPPRKNSTHQNSVKAIS